VLAVFTLKQALGEGAHAFLVKLTRDASVAAWAIRALADHEGQLGRVPADPLLAGARSADARTRLEAVVALARVGRREHAEPLAKLLGDLDPVIAHTVVKALVRLRGAEACFAVVDQGGASPAARTGALRVLQALHEEPVVDGLIARLGRETEVGRRDDLVRALCRLYYVEGKWAGDGWGFGGRAVPPADMPARLGAARIALAPLLPALRRQPFELTHRVYEAAACGAFQITSLSPVTRRFFSDSALVAARDEEEFVRLFEHFIDRPDERNRIAEEALVELYAGHTVFHRIERLMAEMDGLI
jgi:hypothetical protein